MIKREKSLFPLYFFLFYYVSRMISLVMVLVHGDPLLTCRWGSPWLPPCSVLSPGFVLSPASSLVREVAEYIMSLFGFFNSWPLSPWWQCHPAYCAWPAVILLTRRHWWVVLLLVIFATSVFGVRVQVASSWYLGSWWVLPLGSWWVFQDLVVLWFWVQVVVFKWQDGRTLSFTFKLNFSTFPTSSVHRMSRWRYMGIRRVVVDASENKVVRVLLSSCFDGVGQEACPIWCCWNNLVFVLLDVLNIRHGWFSSNLFRICVCVFSVFCWYYLMGFLTYFFKGSCVLVMNFWDAPYGFSLFKKFSAFI